VSSDKVGEIERKFKAVFDEASLTKLGLGTGFTERLRDITPYRLVLAFVSSMGSADIESIADVHRRFNEFNGLAVSYKPFHNQISKENFPEFMRQVLCSALANLAMSVLRPTAGSPLRQFEDILLQDGSSFAVANALAAVFPGRFTVHSPAAVELHATMSRFQDSVVKVVSAPDTRGERDFLPDPATLRRKLIVADRGYEDRDYFGRVDSAGGSFVVRCKANANPKVIECWTASGRARAFAGKKLSTFRNKLHGQNADLLVSHTVDGHEFTYRLVLVWNPQLKSHMVLATNLLAEEFDVQHVRRIYSARWQIELLFKEWKSYANLRKFDTAKQGIAQALIWASLTCSAVKRFFAHATQQVHDVATSTRKVAMCSGNILNQLCRALLGTDDTGKILRRSLLFLSTAAKRDSRRRDATRGRLNAGLEELMEHVELKGCAA